MKKIKLLVVLLIVSATAFYSCTDNSPVENEVVTTKSIALRTTLNALRKANNINGKNSVTTQDQFTCFNFVFPISLSYNDGTVITVASIEGLIEVLTNETSTLYIDGIAFPFQVQEEGTVTTINNEDEFYALIESCTFPTVNDCVFDFTCYEIVYPISIINANNETQVINNQTELMQLVSNPNGTNTYQLNIVFPISVIQNNQTIVINDLFAFFDLNNDCVNNSCICTADYAPVCVQTANGIVEFSNACHAECAGFTTADFVDCNGNNNPCNCPTDFNPVCVQTATGIVQYDNACRAECDGHTASEFVNCNPTPPTFGQLLGSCFNVAYPAQVQYQGALVTVHNDGELLQYWFPNQNYMPAFSYPVTVSFGGVITSYVFTNQADFEAAINTHCN